MDSRGDVRKVEEVIWDADAYVLGQEGIGSGRKDRSRWFGLNPYRYTHTHRYGEERRRRARWSTDVLGNWVGR